MNYRFKNILTVLIILILSVTIYLLGYFTGASQFREAPDNFKIRKFKNEKSKLYRLV